jgi:hypothetical protein
MLAKCRKTVEKVRVYAGSFDYNVSAFIDI